MGTFLDWLRANNDVFGFGVAALIFVITIILVSRKMIGFWITLLFLFFALFSGLLIANQDFFKTWMMKDSHSSPPVKEAETEAHNTEAEDEQHFSFEEGETMDYTFIDNEISLAR